MEARKRKGTNSLPFGENLRKLMRERKLTVRKLSQLAGVNSSVVQSWISKANPHDLTAVATLAHKLGIGFKELLLGQPELYESDDAFLNLEELFEGICRVKIERLVAGKKQNLNQ